MAIHQPHDHLFKRVFGAPAEAASFLQARLPPRLRRSLDWPTLKRHPASFVTPDLRGSASDLLFEVRYTDPGVAQAPGGAQAPLWPWLPRFEHLLFDQTQASPAQAAGSVRARLLQLTMMHAFNRAVREARQRMRPLLGDLEREGSGGQDDMKMFVRYILETGPEDTPEEIGHPAVHRERPEYRRASYRRSERRPACSSQRSRRFS